ncbi:L,D-transpeptidase [Candidatus Microgenomates bacterium]|nr:MAG: L,D-transpeptidase [Candidatus Microgenomates bacterium]
MKTVRLIAVVIVGIFASAHLYSTKLPEIFSFQKDIDVETTLNQGGYYDYAETEGVFEGKPVTSYAIPEPEKLIKVLGESSGTNKRIEVDLAQQKVFAYDGDRRIYEFLVSTGKWGRTPTGEFTIAYKTRAQKMEGGSKALNTYYYLPNVPYVMFFGNSEIPWSRGFSFHGTYWHNNFGTPMSHGCINMKTADAEVLYYWANPENNGKRTIKASEENPGTRVIIYGTTPSA